jgi:hypothetical protein
MPSLVKTVDSIYQNHIPNKNSQCLPEYALSLLGTSDPMKCMLSQMKQLWASIERRLGLSAEN